MENTFYFSHDYNAREDQKILKLIRVLKLEGYGAYWVIIETLAKNGGSLSLDSIEDISYLIRDDNKVITQVIFDFGLFEIDEKENIFYSKRLLKHFEKREVDKTKKSEAGKIGMAKRWGKHNSVITENNTVITDYNKGKERKGKEIKEKKSKYGEYSHVFLTDLEKENIIKDFGLEIFSSYIKKLDEYIELKGVKYKNHNLVIRNWLNKDGGSKKGFEKAGNTNPLEGL